MKLKMRLLPTLLLISSLLVAALGGYIKYGILEPLGIHRDESIVAMPFVLYSDKGLQFMVEVNREMMQQPPTEATQAPAETEAVATETTPVETTAIPAETQAEVPTEAPTEAPTEPIAVELDDSWFENMLIIGDSRTHGMRNYYRFGEAYYFTSIGMNIYNVFGTWTGDQGHYECSLEETLKTVYFDKVMVGIGLNECNYAHPYIQAGFQRLIDMIHSYHPDAKIILTSIMMVSESYSKLDECYQPENLRAINAIMKSFADGEKIFYLDNNEWIGLETDYLPQEITFDGVHLYGENYIEWGTWMRQKLGTYGIE